MSPTLYFSIILALSSFLNDEMNSLQEDFKDYKKIKTISDCANILFIFNPLFKDAMEFEFQNHYIEHNADEYRERYETEELDGIIYCNWAVSKKINDDNFLDIVVSIELPEYHNELCKFICSENERYCFSKIFGYPNGIDGRLDDGREYGVYCNLNLYKDYLEGWYENTKNDSIIVFPWTRCLNRK